MNAINQQCNSHVSVFNQQELVGCNAFQYSSLLISSDFIDL